MLQTGERLRSPIGATVPETYWKQATLGIQEVFTSFNHIDRTDPVVSDSSLMPKTKELKQMTYQLGIDELPSFTTLNIGITEDFFSEYLKKTGLGTFLSVEDLRSAFRENVARRMALNDIRSEKALTLSSPTPNSNIHPLLERQFGFTALEIQQDKNKFLQFYLGTPLHDATDLLNPSIASGIKAERRVPYIFQYGDQFFGVFPPNAAKYRQYRIGWDVYYRLCVQITEGSNPVVIVTEPMPIPVDPPEMKGKMVQALEHIRTRPDQLKQIRRFIPAHGTKHNRTEPLPKPPRAENIFQNETYIPTIRKIIDALRLH